MNNANGKETLETARATDEVAARPRRATVFTLALLLPVVLIANWHFYGIADHLDFDIHSDDVILIERCLAPPGIVDIEPDMPLSRLADIPPRGVEPTAVRLYWHAMDHPALHRWVFHFILKWSGRMPTSLPAEDWDYSKPHDWNIEAGRVAPADARRIVRVTNAAFMVLASVFIYLSVARLLDPAAGFICALLFIDPLNVLGHTIEIIWSLGQDPLLWMLMGATLVLWAHWGRSLWGVLAAGAAAGLAVSTKLNGAYALVAVCVWLLVKKQWHRALLAGAVAFVIFAIVNPVIWSRGFFGAPRVLYDFVAWGRLRGGLYAQSFAELAGKSWLGARAVILGRVWWLWLAGAAALLASPRLRRLEIVPFWAAFVSLFHLVTVPAPAPRYVFAIHAPLLVGLVAAYWPRRETWTAVFSRLRRRPLCLVCLALIACGCVSYPPGSPKAIIAKARIRQGDILFQSITGLVAEMIEGSTGSPYSHCGIVVRYRNGSLGVLESIGFVHETPIEEWLAGGRDGRVAVYRLQRKYRRFIPGTIAACRRYLGKPYDLRYDFDDESIYCSELIYKGFLKASGRPLGRTVKVADLDWQPYRGLMESIEGGPIPLERELITPRDLAKAEELVLVYSTFPTGGAGP